MNKNTEPVDTWWKPGDLLTYNLAADEAKHPVVGALAALDATGKAVSADDASAATVVGRTDKIYEIDEQSGNPEARITVRRGVIALFNDETNPCDETHLGGTATLGADDATAAAPGGAGIDIGKIVEFDEGRVFVEIG